MPKVIEPLRSRCLCIHVPTQSEQDLVQWTFNISSLENVNINLPVLSWIVQNSNGNLKDILWKLDLYKYCGKIQNGYQKSLVLLII